MCEVCIACYVSNYALLLRIALVRGMQASYWLDSNTIYYSGCQLRYLHYFLNRFLKVYPTLTSTTLIPTSLLPVIAMSTTNVVNKTYGDAEWDAQKATIQKIYISDDGSLQALIDIMATSHNFRARCLPIREAANGVPTDIDSKSQYERHFKRWHMRKNLKSHEWKAVRHHSAKRKLNGKESDVYVDGILISHKKVRKETMRNSFASIFDRIAQGNPPLSLLVVASCIILILWIFASSKSEDTRRPDYLHASSFTNGYPPNSIASLVSVCSFSQRS